MPKRNSLSLQEFGDLLQKEEDIILELTETPIDRDHDCQEQKDYIGKKSILRRF